MGRLPILAATPVCGYTGAALLTERTRSKPKLHSPVGFLKPVWVNVGSYENFASLCRQDYPGYQIPLR